MTARAYRITLISLRQRIERSVIAHSTVAALCIGIRMMAELDAPCAITCAPLEAIREEALCAA